MFNQNVKNGSSRSAGFSNSLVLLNPAPSRESHAHISTSNQQLCTEPSPVFKAALCDFYPHLEVKRYMTIQ